MDRSNGIYKFVFKILLLKHCCNVNWFSILYLCFKLGSCILSYKNRWSERLHYKLCNIFRLAVHHSKTATLYIFDLLVSIALCWSHIFCVLYNFVVFWHARACIVSIGVCYDCQVCCTLWCISGCCLQGLSNKYCIYGSAEFMPDVYLDTNTSNIIPF